MVAEEGPGISPIGFLPLPARGLLLLSFIFVFTIFVNIKRVHGWARSACLCESLSLGGTESGDNWRKSSWWASREQAWFDSVMPVIVQPQCWQAFLPYHTCTDTTTISSLPWAVWRGKETKNSLDIKGGETLSTSRFDSVSFPGATMGLQNNSFCILMHSFCFSHYDQVLLFFLFFIHHQKYST